MGSIGGDVNRWELTGRMAKDAEVQESKGRKRLRLRVAVHESGPEGVTHFFTVVLFGAGEEQAEDGLLQVIQAQTDASQQVAYGRQRISEAVSAFMAAANKALGVS